MDVKRPNQVLALPVQSQLKMLDPAPSTFPSMLDQCVRPHGERVFLPRRRANEIGPVTFAALLADVDALAAALLAAGVARGDRVALIAENRYEWLLVDQALASIGAISVPRGVDTSPRELHTIVRHSGCRFAFGDDERIAKELAHARPELPALEQVFVMQATAANAPTIAELLHTGASLLRDRANAERLAAARGAVQPDDLLTIVYTSGTTAEPKGVMLTHGNVLSNLHVVTRVLAVTTDDVFLSVLPAWHMYERILDYVAFASGAQLVYTDRRSIKEDLAAVRPTVFAAVPRIWEMLHDGIVAQAGKTTGVRGRLLRSALRSAQLVGAGGGHFGHRVLHRLLDAIVMRKLRDKLGGRLRLCVSGGGSLPRHVDETLLGLGLPLRNGYGLTETSPVAALRLPHQSDPGHIGPPLPRTQIEVRRSDGTRCGVGETGVLWIRGPQVMRGYYENPARTAEVLTADGWLNSGDLGHQDAAGNLWLTGRAKDTIVLAGGENVEPEIVEAVLKTSPLIEQAVCVGQDQKTLGALLVPQFEELERAVPREQWDARDGALHGRTVQALMRAELDRLLVRANGLRPCDRVTVMCVLAEPLTAENGLLTQTLKVRRHVVTQRFAPAIAAMFTRA